MKKRSAIGIITGDSDVSFNGARAENVTFSYCTETILDDFTLGIEKGAVTGIVGKTKVSIITTVTLLMGFGFFMMARKGIWVPCIILAAVWVCHIIYFVFGVKTVKSPTDK